PETGLSAKMSKLDGTLCSAVDISHRNTAIYVEGPNAAAVLNAGCPQNLSVSAFPKGACSRTILGKSEIILLRESPVRFRVECWRSFSDYVWNFLVDAGKSSQF
ncbi:MAG: sarcosine oxidase subunit gamma family protein, partial [Pseudomonadota bacterium]